MKNDVAGAKATKGAKKGVVQKTEAKASPPQNKTGRVGPAELRRDGAASILRERILSASLGFKSGDILTETRVAEELGLTLNPVRQALSQLANEGLVSILPRVGTQVRIIRPEEARAIMAMRFALETVIVGELARTQPDFSDLRRINEEMRRIATQPTPPNADDKYRFARADMEFHAKMAELANGYTAAVGTIRDLTSQYFLYAYHAISPAKAQTTMLVVHSEHERIIKALEECKGDSSGPTARLHEHIEESVDRLAPFASSYLKKEVRAFLSSVN